MLKLISESVWQVGEIYFPILHSIAQLETTLGQADRVPADLGVERETIQADAELSSVRNLNVRLIFSKINKESIQKCKTV